MTIENYIRSCIEQQLDNNKTKFIIFPFGDIGTKFDSILKNMYGISADYIIDNHLCRYNPRIKPLSFLEEIDCSEYTVFLAATNDKIYKQLYTGLQKYVSCGNIAELDFMREKFGVGHTTCVGRYSYGPICRNHELIESIGSFCSFAHGVEVVSNHEMKFLTTHPMLYAGKACPAGWEREYRDYKNEPHYFEGVEPRDVVSKNKRSIIGHDVWLGRNVIITNGARIGNGVVAGAGAVITKDVPDYAVVAGVPARIIRYRYTPEQIDALNKIQWWNWTDDEIRDRYDDFYLPITDFIKKYI